MTDPALPTRFAGLGRSWARALLALLLIAAAGLALVRGDAPHAVAKSGHGDAALYLAIDTRVLAGEDYYRAAAAEQRAQGYPLKPFVTMRLPTLAWLFRSMGGVSGTLLLFRLLAIAAMLATVIRLRFVLPPRPLWIAATGLAAFADGVMVQPALVFWHEGWAGLLIALSLAVRDERRWWPSVLIGLAAVLFRELALPYLVVMAALAAHERRRAEAIGWGVAILALLGVLALHAYAVAAVLLPSDPTSQGWSSFGGWRFDMVLLRDTSLLGLPPRRIGSLLVLLALTGWVAARGDYARRFALTLALWLGAFLLIGRPENFYWGLLIAPLLPIGVVLAIPALRDLVRAAQ